MDHTEIVKCFTPVMYVFFVSPKSVWSKTVYVQANISLTFPAFHTLLLINKIAQVLICTCYVSGPKDFTCFISFNLFHELGLLSPSYK